MKVAGSSLTSDFFLGWFIGSARLLSAPFLCLMLENSHSFTHINTVRTAVCVCVCAWAKRKIKEVKCQTKMRRCFCHKHPDVYARNFTKLFCKVRWVVGDRLGSEEQFLWNSIEWVGPKDRSLGNLIKPVFKMSKDKEGGQNQQPCKLLSIHFFCPFFRTLGKGAGF